jgi:16S rRNA (guanine527-N7)-methyltransferase
MRSIFKDLKNIPEVSDKLYAKFANLHTLLCSENSKNNLTRITDPEEYWIKHIYDSLLIADIFPCIIKEGTKLADLGCGAGFPSIVLAAAFPEIKVTAIDSIGKKTAFVKKAAEVLHLENLNVVTGRGRELAAKEENQNCFDYITARAVAEIKIIFRESRRMLKSDGKMVLFKTPEAAEKELCEVRRISGKTGFKWELSDVFVLPENRGKRIFAIGSKSD